MATFQSLRDTRQPKAEKAVSLLTILARYDHAEHEAKALVNALGDAVDAVDTAFAKKWGWDDDMAPAPAHTPPEPVPTGDACPPEFRGLSGTAEGGASVQAEIGWALDAIKRGDTKLAENRLKRILKGGAA